MCFVKNPKKSEIQSVRKKRTFLFSQSERIDSSGEIEKHKVSKEKKYTMMHEKVNKKQV